MASDIKRQSSRCTEVQRLKRFTTSRSSWPITLGRLDDRAFPLHTATVKTRLPHGNIVDVVVCSTGQHNPNRAVDFGPQQMGRRQQLGLVIRKKPLPTALGPAAAAVAQTVAPPPKSVSRIPIVHRDAFQ